MKEGLEEAGGGEHRILVGDVGDGEFWGLLKKEVSLVLCVKLAWGGSLEVLRKLGCLRSGVNEDRNMLIYWSMQLESPITLLFLSRVQVFWKRL